MAGGFDRVMMAVSMLAILGSGWTSARAEPQSASSKQILSGQWKIATDPENCGRADRWFKGVRPEATDAPVPGIIQQVFPSYHGVAWYWHSFHAALGGATDDRTLIRFGAVDYLADVWLNGKHVGTHEGGETPFEFDVSLAIRAQGENLLAVRVLNPTAEPIDGYVLRETPHRNRVAPTTCGSSFNCGGIIYPVELRRVPPVHVTDIFVRPDAKTGQIAVTLTVQNSQDQSARGTLALALSAAVGGDVLQTLDQQTEFPIGLSRREMTIRVAQPRLWSLEDPFLYRVTATAAAPSQRPHQHSVRCGFRDFRIVDGYFHLNGKRIFLRSTHTGNAMPVGQQVNVVGDFGRRDMIYAKASGFNMVRFIAGVAYPEQLDFCDELGLLVYEECLAAWLLEDSPKMAERFDGSTAAMILRDRNHASVVIWGLLNETQDGPVFRRAVGFLPRLRELDPTRLSLLDSGRWDGQWSIGSASNPGSGQWQSVWGVEGPGVASTSLSAGGYTPGAGDAHFYPAVPQTPETDRFIRELGREGKPVFLSEYGIGSLMDVIDEWRRFEQIGARSDLEDAAMLREQSETLIADWKRLGFDGVYAFPEDLLRESQRLHARQRTLGFNCIRSNPKLCGYNLTGILDHGMTGEGLWTYWRRWKPATFDAVSDGWSPLRWCLFAEPLHVYRGREATVEAVLANEDVLKPGQYPARFRVFGAGGPVWEKRATVTIPETPTLAVPVIRATFQLDVPAGQYAFAANLEQGGSPTGGRLTFHVSDSASLPSLAGEVAVWGIDAKVQEWLTAQGLHCRPLAANAPDPREVVLVGTPNDAEANPAMWASLSSHTAVGGSVVFLSGRLFREGKAAMTWLPLQNKGRCRTIHDWLYHKVCVANRHPVFDGLQGPGIMDWDYYGPIVPKEVFEGQDTPDETIAAGFATGNAQFGNGYGSCLLMAMYKSGKGRIVLSTPYILENLDTHPAADRLLANLIRYAQQTASR